MKRLYYPSNLDLSIFDGFRKEFKYKLLFFISTVYFRRVTNKKFKSDLDYINLSSDILGQFIRRNDVKRVKDDLIRLGIIETDGLSVLKKKCLGFRFAAQYRGVKFKSIPNPYPKESKKQQIQTDAQRYLRETLEQITIQPEAFPYIEKAFAESVDRYESAFRLSELIQDKDWFFAVDEKTGRVFNNVTNLNSELRQFLRLDGQELFEIDVANCQPSLLYALYKNKKSSEACRYLDLVKNGKFYEYLLFLTGKKDRDAIKKEFLVYLFASLEDLAKWKLPIHRVFRLQFPELAEVIGQTKEVDFKQLALKLQSLEAGVIIEKIVPLCAAKGIPVLSIHDSILTTKEHQATIKAMIEEEFKSQFSIGVTVRVK